MTRAETGAQAGQPRYFFSRRAECALDRLPDGFVLAGEAPATGVPVLKKVRLRDTALVRRSA